MKSIVGNSRKTFIKTFLGSVMSFFLSSNDVRGNDKLADLSNDGYGMLSTVIWASKEAEEAPTKIENLKKEGIALKSKLAMKLLEEQESKESKKMEKAKAEIKRRMEHDKSPIGAFSGGKRRASEGSSSGVKRLKQ